MKIFFDPVFCCKTKKAIIKEYQSDLAEDFFREFVDVRSIILLLDQLKHLKNATLPKYQNIVLNGSKIILNRNEMMIMQQNETLFHNYFDKIKKKIKEGNYDPVDFMLFNKF